MRPIVVFLALFLSGCVVEVPPPVPRPRVETLPPPPAPRLVWQPGEWRYQAGTYLWVKGRYVRRLASYHRWVPAHWNTKGAWVDGRWT